MVGLPAHSLWALHLADGVLSWPWLLVGFLVAGCLAIAASWRVREDEIPRIALLTAAFFVASSIHVRIGPTSVHLLLIGLVGVVLGWRAPLAILVGVTLQALLIPHGGLTTIGINAALEAIPALLAGALFPLLLYVSRRSAPARIALVGGTAFLWGACLVFGVAALVTNPWHELVRPSGSGEPLARALAVLFHPATILGLVVFAGAAVVLERRLENGTEFPAGAGVGAFAVIATTLLTGIVLITDGADHWGPFVSAVFVAHLPLALLEGLILGVVVCFLARVQPALIGSPSAPVAQVQFETGNTSSSPTSH